MCPQLNVSDLQTYACLFLDLWDHGLKSHLKKDLGNKTHMGFTVWYIQMQHDVENTSGKQVVWDGGWIQGAKWRWYRDSLVTIIFSTVKTETGQVLHLRSLPGVWSLVRLWMVGFLCRWDSRHKSHLVIHMHAHTHAPSKGPFLPTFEVKFTLLSVSRAFPWSWSRWQNALVFFLHRNYSAAFLWELFCSFWLMIQGFYLKKDSHNLPPSQDSE